MVSWLGLHRLFNYLNHVPASLIRFLSQHNILLHIFTNSVLRYVNLLLLLLLVKIAVMFYSGVRESRLSSPLSITILKMNL